MQSRTSISDSGNLRAFIQPSTFNLQPTFSVACTPTPIPVRKKDQSHADRSIADGLLVEALPPPQSACTVGGTSRLVQTDNPLIFLDTGFQHLSTPNHLSMDHGDLFRSYTLDMGLTLHVGASLRYSS
jgi:hypothetical protein